MGFIPDAEPHRHRDLRQSRGAVELYRGRGGARHVAAGREQGGDPPRGKARRAVAQSHDAPAQPDRGGLGAVSAAACARWRKSRTQSWKSRVFRPSPAALLRVSAPMSLQHPAAGAGDSKLPDALSRRHARAEPRRSPGRSGGGRLRCRRTHRPAAGLEPDRTQDRAVPAGAVRFACLSRETRRRRSGPRICSSTTASCIRCSARRASGGWSTPDGELHVGADQRHDAFEQRLGESSCRGRGRRHRAAADVLSRRATALAARSSRCCASSSRRRSRFTPSIPSAAT